MGGLTTNKETGNDVIYAGAGDDGVNAGAGDDIVYAGSGNDSVAGYEGSDIIDGGSGNDWLLGDAPTMVLDQGRVLAQNVVDFYSAPLVTRFVLDARQHGSDIIDGGEGNDHVEGGGQSDLLSGGDGNDLIFGDDFAAVISGSMAGDDLMDGGLGDDELFGGGGRDTMLGGEGVDFLVGDWMQDDGVGGAGDHLEGGAGNDVIFGAAGDDILLGGEGDDVLRGDATVAAHSSFIEYALDAPLYSTVLGADRLEGGSGNDWLYGDGGNDQLLGGEGDDHLNGGTGDDLLQGGEGRDRMLGGEGRDALDGGSGDDYLSGEAGDDVLLGGEGGDNLLGGEGDDVLVGGKGVDRLNGGAGNDTYRFVAGDASLQGAQGGERLADAIDDTEGVNRILLEGASIDDVYLTKGKENSLQVVVSGGGSGNLGQGTEAIIVMGGAVRRTISSVEAEGRSVDFETLVNQRLQEAQNLTASGGDKYLLGGARGDTLNLLADGGYVAAGRGNDSIVLGGSGNVVRVNVGDGDEVIAGDPTLASSGNAILFGASIRPEDLVLSRAAGGAIRIEAKDRGTSVTIQGGGISELRFIEGDATVNFTALVRAKLAPLQPTDADDWLEGLSIDDIINGGAGNDVLIGMAGNDVLSGDAGDDLVIGGVGNDTLDGGDGSDNLNGGEGDDVLISDGKDYLNGSLGDDLYRITFSEGVDFSNAGIIDDKSGVSWIEVNNGPSQSKEYAVFSQEGRVFLAAGKNGIVELVVGMDYSRVNLVLPFGQRISLSDLIAQQNSMGEVDSGTWSASTGVIWDRTSTVGKNITGTAGDDLLSGGSGDDRLIGLAGDDVLVGGKGQDILIGGVGVNRYVFNRGDAVDSIQFSQGEAASLEFNGIGAASVRASKIGGDLWFYLGQGDAVRLSNYSGNERVFDKWSVLIDGQVGAFNDFLAGRLGESSLQQKKAAFLDSQYTALRTQRQYLVGSGWGSNEPPRSVERMSFDLVGGEFEFQPYLARTTSSRQINKTSLEPIYEKRETPAVYTYVDASQWPATGYIGHPMPVYVDSNLPGPKKIAVGFLLNTAPGDNYMALVGWKKRIETSTVVSHVDTALQSIILGSAKADGIFNLARGQFRGVIETGAGDDYISIASDFSVGDTAVLPASTPLDFLASRGMGAWVDAGVGDDVVYGTDADDVIVGGRGSDYLYGAQGADVYVMSAPEKGEIDVIRDRAQADSWWLDAYGGLLNQDVVEFDETVRVEDLSYRWMMRPDGGSIKTLELFFNNELFLQVDYAAKPGMLVGMGVEKFSFSNGRVFDVQGLTDFLPMAPEPAPPVVLKPLSDLLVMEDEELIISLSGGNFSDSQGRRLVYSARLQNGEPLPEWINVDGNGGRIYGRPENAHVGTVSIVIAATNDAGLSVNDTFELTVGNVNDAPTAGPALPGQQGWVGEAFRIELPADAFRDEDVNDRLQLSAVLQGAEPLPEWLSFDNATGTFSGTPPAGAVGALVIQVTAVDNAGATATQSLSLVIAAASEPGLTVIGTTGNDGLTGTSGDDTFDGGGGNDTLSGGSGNDTYLFGRGDGQDTITFDYAALEGKLNVLRFKPGVSAQDVTVRRSGDSLVLGIAGTTDQVTVENFFFINDPQNLSNPVQQVRFDDGTTWSIDALTSMPMVGGAGDDVLAGSVAGDVINGNAGNDRLSGGAGNDTYLFGRGDGQDTITFDYAALEGKLNVLRFKPGVSAQDVTVRRSGDSLVVGIAGTTDQVTVENFFFINDPQNLSNPVQQVLFDDGTTWSIDALTPMAMVGGSSDDVLVGSVAGDVINGNAGNDRLSGGAGNDTYLFGRGDGQDTIAFDYAALDGKLNAVRFKPGVSAQDVTVQRSGDSLVLGIAGTSDQVTVENFFFVNDPQNLSNPVQQVRFDDGTTWDIDALVARAMTGGPGDDSLMGTVAADVIVGNAGNDSLYGRGGDDVLEGGAGHDLLLGEAGNDTLKGGAGADWIEGGAGNDTYLFGRGDGADGVADVDATEGNVDTLQFLSGIASDQLWFEQVSGTSALRVSVIGTDDSVTIHGWYDGAANHVEQFRTFDGKTLTDAGVANLVQAMASFSPPAAGQTTLPQDYADSLQPRIAANWQ